MRRQTLGLCMIVKNEEDSIARAIDSVAEFVDAIYLTDTGSTDKTIEVATKAAKRHNTPIEISHFKWIDDFSAARQFNFEQAKTDWVFWIDADDTVENAEYLPRVIQEAGIVDATGVNLLYRYQVNEKGQDVVVHARLRIVKNGDYEWTKKAPIHENLFYIAEGGVQREIYNSNVIVRHWVTDEEFQKSGERNLRILKKLEAQEGLKPDPRTVWLLGREHHAHGDYEIAKEYLERFIEMDRFGHNRQQACGLLCDIHMKSGDFNKELQYAYEAVKSDSNSALGYIYVATAYLHFGKWQEVIDWVQRGLTKDFDVRDGAIYTPAGIKRNATYLLAEAYNELEEYEKAIQVLKHYKKEATKQEAAMIDQQIYEMTSDNTGKKLIEGFVRLANNVLSQDKLEQVQGLIDSLPDFLHDKPQVLNFRRAVGLSREWSKGNIVIWCGLGYEEWDENSLSRGIGGSETAVIEMARRWGESGYKVTVYGSVKEERHFGNVKYVPANEIDWADRFDIFISWRNPIVYKLINVSARKKYIWLHDVPNPQDYTDEIVDQLDKIIVLSQYHRSLLPAIPDDKFYISRNGIDVETIEKIEQEGIKRNPKKVIYASSPDRGLDRLLESWEKIKKEVPDAELVWAYGWDTYDALRKSPEHIEWKRNMNEKMDKLGVKQLGRLSKEDLYREMFSSAVWAYPTKFQEISCITAMEAQACGCTPITSGFAALEETQLSGYRCSRKNDFEITLKREIDRESLKGYPNSTDMARKRFTWDKVAGEWEDDLFYGKDFEMEMPLVSVVCTTIRPGIFRILKEQIEKQTYPNIELVVVDGRYDERKLEVKQFFKGFKYPILHLPDPQRDKKKYPYGLCHAHNAALEVVNGKLIVFLQDFIMIEEDAIEKYVELYRNHPDKIYTGVDIRVGYNNQDVDTEDKIDVFKGEGIELGDVQFKNQRNIMNGAVRRSIQPQVWELNWAAAPKDILDKLGGWNNDWDSGFGYDNTELALRFVYMGGIILIDETNMATAISHWDMSEGDKFGVPERTKKTNDRRYSNYLSYLKQNDNANVIIKNEKSKYNKTIRKAIQRFKSNT